MEIVRAAGETLPSSGAMLQRSIVDYARLVRLATAAAMLLGSSAYGQGSLTGALWTGSAQCQVQGSGDSETQTWTLKGEPPKIEGAMQVYAATWTATGGGSSHTSNIHVSTSDSWYRHPTSISAPIAFFIRAQGGKLIIKAWHSQLHAAGALTGESDAIMNPGTPSETERNVPFTNDVYEWTFPTIEDDATSTKIVGTVPVPNLGRSDSKQPINVPGTCSWQFINSATSVNENTNEQKCSQAGDSTSQAFDAMKADIVKRFDALLQQTQDPATIADLRSQEETLLKQVENLKQQNLKMSSGSCQSDGTQVGQNWPVRRGSDSGSTPTRAGDGPLAPPGGPNPSLGSSRNLPGSGSTDPGQNPNSDSQRSPAAQLLKVEPSSAEQNTATLQVALTAQGTHWERGKTTLNFGPGITLKGEPFYTPTTAYVVISVAADAAPGPRIVSVTTPLAAKRETVSLPNAFNVTAPTNPNARQGMTIVDPSQPINQARLPGAGGAPQPGSTAGTGGQAALTDPSQLPNTGGNPTGGSTPSHRSAKSGLPGVNVANLPTTQPSASPTSGNYLVTITHLRAVTSIEMNNDPRDQDGKGDEIYATTWVRRYDRAGNFLEQSNVQSKVYGDTRNLPPQAREQAGSLSATGGIRSGDNIPANATDRRWSAPSDSTFPLKLWQGTLTAGGDVLILSPSIWESNEDQSVLSVWGQAQNALGDSLWNKPEVKPEVQNQINQRIFGPLVLGNVSGLSGNMGAATASVISASLGIPVLALPARAILGGGFDRPVGLSPSGVDATTLPNVTIVLTQEIIERALTGGLPAQVSDSAFGHGIVGPGIIAIDFQDTFQPSDWTGFNAGLGVNAIPGKYRLVLQVERVP